MKNQRKQRMMNKFFKYLISLVILCLLMLVRSFFWAFVLQLVWNVVVVGNQIIASNEITYWQSYLICALVFLSKSVFYARGTDK